MSGRAEREWLYEELLDRMPPFSIFPRESRVLLQLALMEAVGLAIAFSGSLPIKSAIDGSLMILAVVIWSQVAVYIGPHIRSLRNPSSLREMRIIEQYKQVLFSRRRFEALLGLLIFSLLLYYLVFTHDMPISRWLGSRLEIVPTVLVLVLLWDVAYRIGLGLWASLMSLRRSLKLREASMARFRLGYTPYRELHTLKRLDLTSMAFLLGVVPIVPVCVEDGVLLYATATYALLVFVTSLSSWIIVDSVPIYPVEVLWLLNEGLYAYMGTASKDGQPHVSPVIFVFDGKAVYALISKVSAKLKNLRENDRIALLIDVRDPADFLNNRAILVKGRVKIFSLIDAVASLPRLIKLREMFHRKYPQYMRHYAEKGHKLPLAWRTTLFISRLLIRIDAEEFQYWRRVSAIYVPT